MQRSSPSSWRRCSIASTASRRRTDLVIVEGAGSPAEVNLRANDIANMGFARATDTPVILVGDIDRGGVIAQLVGTQAVLDPQDAAMIKGFLINKFRGDVRLFDEGYRLIEQRTGWRGLGVVPWFPDAHRLPAEDALDIADTRHEPGLRVVCLQFARIANFDDLDPLRAEPGVALTMLRAGEAIPGDADLVILPGSKSTRGDLAFLRQQGWDIDLSAHHRRGGRVLGLCGGYQMLGSTIRDPEGLEGPPGETPGLGLLDLVTTMSPDKTLTRVSGTHCGTGEPISGYEIHLGVTEGPSRAPALRADRWRIRRRRLGRWPRHGHIPARRLLRRPLPQPLPSGPRRPALGPCAQRVCGCDTRGTGRPSRGPCLDRCSAQDRRARIALTRLMGISLSDCSTL